MSPFASSANNYLRICSQRRNPAMCGEKVAILGGEGGNLSYLTTVLMTATSMSFHDSGRFSSPLQYPAGRSK